MIDSEGYRPNVGIILSNADGRLFWARRIGQHSWQFPQGGIRRDESPEQAMFRELAEEVGLRPEHVQIIGCTSGWLRYRLPKHLIRRGNPQTCIGQKQVWFLLRMVSGEDRVRLDATEHPEFDHWQWVDYWYPLRAVVPFKRHVYWRALRELAPLLFPYRATYPSSAQIEKASGVERRPPAIKPTTVLPLRRMDIHHHPVITRMVVSARRGGAVDQIVVASPPAREAAAPTPALDKPCAPRPPAPRSRRLIQR